MIMMRRNLLGACLAPVAKADHDPLMDRWNKFAEVANLWARRRNEGIVDLESMRESQRLWEKLTKCEGWPRG